MVLCLFACSLTVKDTNIAAYPQCETVLALEKLRCCRNLVNSPQTAQLSDTASEIDRRIPSGLGGHDPCKRAAFAERQREAFPHAEKATMHLITSLNMSRTNPSIAPSVARMLIIAGLGSAALLAKT